jgi:hypothetical protein
VITFKQYLEEARYQSSQGTDNGRKVVNAALEAVPKLKEAGEQVFVANFKEIAPGDSDIFLKTYKELLDRFGEPDWKYSSSDSQRKDPYWDLDEETYLTIHHVGVAIILR